MFHTSPKLTSGTPRITSPGRAFYVHVRLTYIPERRLAGTDFLFEGPLSTTITGVSLLPRHPACDSTKINSKSSEYLALQGCKAEIE
jgi:hypothetical protein